MSGSTSVKQLVVQTLPSADPALHARLVQHSTQTLADAPHRGQTHDWNSLLDHLGRTVATGGAGGPQNALKFSQLASQLKNEVAALAFLDALASPNPSTYSNPQPPRRPDAVPELLVAPGCASTSHKQPLAALLASHRARPNSTLQPSVPEKTLLRDIIYILQGIDAEYIRFAAPSSSPGARARPFVGGEIQLQDEGDGEGSLEEGIEFVLDGKGVSIPSTTRVLLHTLAELGWLYRKIDAVLAEPFGVAGRGMVEQSLHAALRKEMTEYFRLVAILEGLQEQEEGEGEPLTLRKLLVWTEDVRLRMRLMATLVDEAGRPLPGGGKNIGGALLTSLHARTSHGDPFIASFASSLLRALAVPFFATLAAWIFEGELRDPFGEFFVEENPREAVDDEEGEVSRREEEDEGVGKWEGKFRFRKEMLPGFLEEGFGRKIFSTGKSLNFMKYSCQDAAWVVEHNRAEGASRVLQYADMPGLERSITLAYAAASQRLCALFFGPFRLLDHLRAIRDYLLLGKGDFVEILMENLGPSLARPAHTLYRHNLTATLETALRGSTSSHDNPDTLRRLDARMLEFTQGELGWDVFTLEYKVEAPLSTVLNSESLDQYLALFKHLWQIKRVEYELNALWRRLMTGARTFLRVRELAFTFHQTRLALSEMVFFVRQLQYYCHLEVIAVAYKTFEEAVLKPDVDFDSLLEAHRVYVKRLVSKALLRPENPGNWRTTEPLLETVRKIFATVLNYQEAADSLCNYALSEAGRADSLHDLARGIDVPPSPIFSSRSTPTFDTRTGIEDRLAEYSGRFRALAMGLIASLGKAPDGDLRFLAVRLNYNYRFVPGKSEGTTVATANARMPSTLAPSIATARAR